MQDAFSLLSQAIASSDCDSSPSPLGRLGRRSPMETVAVVVVRKQRRVRATTHPSQVSYLLPYAHPKAAEPHSAQTWKRTWAREAKRVPARLRRSDRHMPALSAALQGAHSRRLTLVAVCCHVSLLAERLGVEESLSPRFVVLVSALSSNAGSAASWSPSRKRCHRSVERIPKVPAYVVYFAWAVKCVVEDLVRKAAQPDQHWEMEVRPPSFVS